MLGGSSVTHHQPFSSCLRAEEREWYESSCNMSHHHAFLHCCKLGMEGQHVKCSWLLCEEAASTKDVSNTLVFQPPDDEHGKHCELYISHDRPISYLEMCSNVVFCEVLQEIVPGRIQYVATLRGKPIDNTSIGGDEGMTLLRVDFTEPSAPQSQHIVLKTVRFTGDTRKLRLAYIKIDGKVEEYPDGLSSSRSCVENSSRNEDSVSHHIQRLSQPSAVQPMQAMIQPDVGQCAQNLGQDRQAASHQDQPVGLSETSGLGRNSGGGAQRQEILEMLQSAMQVTPTDSKQRFLASMAQAALRSSRSHGQGSSPPQASQSHEHPAGNLPELPERSKTGAVKIEPAVMDQTLRSGAAGEAVNLGKQLKEFDTKLARILNRRLEVFEAELDKLLGRKLILIDEAVERILTHVN